MCAGNWRQRNVFLRTAALLTLDLSRKLDAISPRLERVLFKVPLKLWRTMNRLRGYGTV
jgi:hypothetical protein